MTFVGGPAPDGTLFSFTGVPPHGARIDPASGTITWAISPSLLPTEVVIPVDIIYLDDTRDQVEAKFIVKEVQGPTPGQTTDPTSSQVGGGVAAPAAPAAPAAKSPGLASTGAAILLPVAIAAAGLVAGSALVRVRRTAQG